MDGEKAPAYMTNLGAAAKRGNVLAEESREEFFSFVELLYWSNIRSIDHVYPFNTVEAITYLRSRIINGQ